MGGQERERGKEVDTEKRLREGEERGGKKRERESGENRELPRRH